MQLLQLLAIALLAMACRDHRAADEPCTCTPANAGQAPPMTGAELLGRLREHRRMVEAHLGARDVKVYDDQLRFAIGDFCHPCSGWVRDRATIEELFPMQRLDEAGDVICLGFVLRDGTTAYGEDRPRACR